MKKPKPALMVSALGLKCPVFIVPMDSHLYGFFDPNKIEIYLNVSEDQKFHSYLHECGHLIFSRTGIGQTSLSRDIEEIIVENFASFIVENWDDILKAKKKLESK